MNVYALITFVAGLVYVSLGTVGLKIDWRARLNQIFFLLCIACAWWSFCIAFMFSADNYNTAWLLFRLSSLGFCLGPPLILHFTIYLISQGKTITHKWLALGIYIPGLVFTVLGIKHGLTANLLVHKSFGWDNLSANWSSAYWAYVIYYTLCVVASIILVASWGLRSQSRRRRRQAFSLTTFSILGLVFASGSEVLPPMLGITSIPKMPAVMWLFWAYGAWYAITKYRLLIMTPQIATQAIVSSITDMLIMLDYDGKITIVNQALYTHLDYTTEELIGQPGSIIMADKNYIPDTLKGMVTGIKQDKIKLDYVKKGGEPIPVFLSCSAIIDNFDEIVGMVLIAQDLRPTLLLEYQNNELEAISADLLESNMALGRKSIQIKNILDNVGQGFLTFGPDLRIHNDYSRECAEILGVDPESKTLSELIYPTDKEQKMFLDSLLAKIFTQNSGKKLSLYLPLLPSEVDINGRCINTEYKLVNKTKATESDYIITILTDITEKRLLEEKMQEEKKNLRMVVKAIAYYDQFIECIEDYHAFTQKNVYQILQGSVPIEEKYVELFRAVHTFKGNFSQFDTIYIVKRLHNLETALSKTRDKLKITDENKLVQMFNELKMQMWLDDDLAIINRFLGDDFLQKKDTFTVNKEKLQEIENNMLKILPAKEYTLLLPYVRKLRYKPFKDMLKTYPEYVLQLASRLGKSVNPFNIEGSDIMVDNDIFHFFARSLINVFRNMVDHGIEYMDDRILQGKSEIGNIRCFIEDTADRILLIIADDGAGLDLDRIKEVAMTAGLYTKEELAACSDDQVARLIFEDNFSTSEEISEVSGRGIGLSAIKDELERLNGSVQITTGKGIGTTFVFSLPNPHCSTDLPNISQEEIVLAIIQTLREFSFSHLKQKLNSDYQVIATDRVCLNRYTAMINVRGIVDGTVVISYSESLLSDLVNIFVGHSISPEEKQDLLEDVTAETTNIIIGNSLKKLGPLEDLLTLGTPTVTSNRAATIKHSHAHIYTCSLEKDDYIVTSSFVPN